jgi:hypothetical protein
MIINLKKIKYYFLTTGKNDKRKKHILDTFRDYDITEVNPVLGISKFQSGSIGMSRMIDIGLRQKPFKPFVIIEDDVSFYRKIPETITIPEDADLLYIGISMCGGFNNTDQKKIFAEDVNDDLVRIYNMLSCHGIIICSPSGAVAFQRCMVEAYFKNMYWDLPVSHIQPYYNVYALKKPLLYQDKEYNGCENVTKFELKEYYKPNIIKGGYISVLMCNQQI